MDRSTIEAISVAAFGKCQMAAALSRGIWYSLVTLDGLRFSDLPLGFQSEDLAREACYSSLIMYTEMRRAIASEKNCCVSKNERVPDFRELPWKRVTNPQAWFDEYCKKTVWPTDERAPAAIGAHV